MKDRKILVEVTPEEYEKIVAGNLDATLETFSTEQLIHELTRRTENKKVVPTGYDIASMTNKEILVGTIELSKYRKHSDIQIFEWSLKFKW